MCIVYNTVGALTVVKDHMRQHGVTEFNSLNELIAFQKNYVMMQGQIQNEHTFLIEQEKQTLQTEIPQTEAMIEARKASLSEAFLNKQQLLTQQLTLYTSAPNGFIPFFQKLLIRMNMSKNELYHKLKSTIVTRPYTQKLKQKQKRYTYLSTHFQEAVQHSSARQRLTLEKKKNIIDQINTSIYGAIGEQKVVRELEHLPDNCILINDFTSTFNPPIYHHKDKSYIKSVQIDHILITPAGVFLIETKNWSEHSLQNISLRSPVAQIQRANYALYKHLSDIAAHILDPHRWGDRKIPVKNLIVFINQKPREEFQYVKILTLSELLNYISYFQPIFSDQEIEMIARQLQKNIKSIS